MSITFGDYKDSTNISHASEVRKARIVLNAALLLFAPFYIKTSSFDIWGENTMHIPSNMKCESNIYRREAGPLNIVY
jgi:hypothetical protein